MNARRLLTKHVHNMRELGGYATEDGGMTKWRRFIRSDAPLEMEAEDAAVLKAYGVRTIIDLRASDEAAWQPCRHMEGFDYENIAFTDDFTYLGASDYCPKDHLVPIIQGTHRTAEILSRMAQAEGAVLFFCYAGKDRTGMISALLLLTAGVPLVDIIADYQVTYTYIREKLNRRMMDAGFPDSLAKVGISKEERPAHLRRTEPEWIEPFMTHVLSYGGIDAFLTHIGMTPEAIMLLRNKLTA